MGTEETPDWQPVIQGENADAFYAFSDGWPAGEPLDYMLDMGTKVAPYTMGFSNYFKVGDFDFSFIITGKFGHVFRHHSFNYPAADQNPCPMPGMRKY